MAFFEQIGKRLSDAGQNVAQQTRNLADVTQLTNLNSQKERQISQLYAAIGQAYYENHKNDPAAEELEGIQKINALYAEILQNQEKIKQIKGVTKCEICGADVPASATFCNACGAKVARVVATAEVVTGARLCPVCGSGVAEGNLFCTNCGNRMDNNG